MVPVHPWLAAFLLGILEGATEFLPVSSTGHLILAGDLLGFTGDRAKAFEIFIQLGAILAIVWVYRQIFLDLVTNSLKEPRAARLTRNLAIAFLPAAIVGLLTHDWIKRVLFSPPVVAWALVVGGILILLIEWWQPADRIDDVDGMSGRLALGVGLAQVLSLVPGTSRAGATIMGGFAMGMSRAAATLFSFYLAVPVMLAATGYDLLKSRAALTATDVPVFAIGFVVAFISALIVVRMFLRFISHHTFRVFAWYRIAFGLVLLVLLWTGAWRG